MLAATGGSNAHRGAIWALGPARRRRRDRAPLGATAAGIGGRGGRHRAAIADQRSHRRPRRVTASGRRTRYGVGGRARARRRPASRMSLGVGAAGAPRGARAWACRRPAPGSTRCWRSWPASTTPACFIAAASRRSQAAQAGAARARGGRYRQHRPDARALQRLACASSCARWASPGGSADLLAATLFLDRLERESAQPRPQLRRV